MKSDQIIWQGPLMFGRGSGPPTSYTRFRVMNRLREMADKEAANLGLEVVREVFNVAYDVENPPGIRRAGFRLTSQFELSSRAGATNIPVIGLSMENLDETARWVLVTLESCTAPVSLE